jgi:hypothetical protein
MQQKSWLPESTNCFSRRVCSMGLVSNNDQPLWRTVNKIAMLSPAMIRARATASTALLVVYLLHGARTCRFIAVFTRAHHWPLSWANWIHSIPNLPISLRSILIPPPIYVLVFQVVSSLWAFPQKPCTLSSLLPCMPHVPPTSFSLIWSA